MEKDEHARLLARAIRVRGLDRSTVANYANVKPRTVTNWTSGTTFPSERERDRLRSLLGPYDSEGDAVEVAVRMSGLEPFRQTRVILAYQEQLYEQERANRTGT